MTFGEALTKWREDVLVDQSSDWFTDDQGLALLLDAAKQIADGLRLLRGSSTMAIADGAVFFDSPVDMLGAEPLSVSINGVNLTPARLPVVREKQSLPPQKYPRYYHFDPGGVDDPQTYIEFAPPVKGAVAPGGMLVSYYMAYDISTLDGASEIWNGRYAAFHHLVVLLAGVTTFQGLELYQRAAYFAQRFNEELQKFAAVLGNTNIASLIVPPEQRMDPGRVTA